MRGYLKIVSFFAHFRFCLHFSQVYMLSPSSTSSAKTRRQYSIDISHLLYTQKHPHSPVNFCRHFSSVLLLESVPKAAVDRMEPRKDLVGCDEADSPPPLLLFPSRWMGTDRSRNGS